jgi:peptidoglycan/LPS O-acetylase OafA/YrhL
MCYDVLTKPATCGISADNKIMNLLTKSLPMRMRKLIGTVILLVFIPAYALMAMAVTGGPGVINANKWIQMLCYIVAGTLWAFPAGMLIRWMQRDDAPTG